jgi:hypothetical protein
MQKRSVERRLKGQVGSPFVQGRANWTLFLVNPVGFPMSRLGDTREEFQLLSSTWESQSFLKACADIHEYTYRIIASLHCQLVPAVP